MRCGGCGAKVGADILDAALGRLPRHPRPDVVSGLESPDDAALLRIPAGRLLAVSVDAFRPMLDDPFLFGRIAANHCLNDLYAMGADPQSALAIVALPVWPQEKLVEELWQMLSGAVSLLSSENVALIGGHTSEAAEISLGFSVTGLVADTGVLTKQGLVTGDQLVLCKPIGTGVILAAHMRGRARGRWMDAAIDTMSQSNARAADVFREHGAHTCTDVTGFGLLGHLLEMARPGSARIRLALDDLPLIEGASDCLRLGIASTMQPKNERILRRVSCASALRDHALFPLLCDPQTAGGLLAALPADKASNCVSALQAAGFSRSAIIGTVVEANARPPGLIDLAD
jgi:selenide,water dikinase